MTTAQDAAVLYFALHGTDAPLTCQFLYDEPSPALVAKAKAENRLDLLSKGPWRCGGTLAGLGHDDGCPLCEFHRESEGGHVLSEDTLAELWIIKRTLDSLKENATPMSNLEAFALKVSGHYSEERAPDSGVVKADTMPAPPLEDHQGEKPWENNYESDDA